MMDRKTCPKHVEFYSKNKFEKLVHHVGFIIRISITYQFRKASSFKTVISKPKRSNTLHHKGHHVHLLHSKNLTQIILI